MEKETLEEAGLKHCDMLDKFPALVNPLFSFKEGAKWMQERMYSEEEILDIFHKFSTHLPFHYEFLVKTHFKKN